MVSSGRYTQIDGTHRRVPFGCCKIGRIASGECDRFLTNDVVHDPQVADHDWARSLGLVSFAGYRLHDAGGNAIGVLGVFAKHAISEEDDAFLLNLAETTSKVILENEAAETVRRETAKLSAMISGMDEGVVFADARDVIVEVNDFFCRLVGQPKDESKTCIVTPYLAEFFPDSSDFGRKSIRIRSCFNGR
jgi:PAS domain-containing protein